jgi:hypothetical protein
MGPHTIADCQPLLVASRKVDGHQAMAFGVGDPVIMPINPSVFSTVPAPVIAAPYS